MTAQLPDDASLVPLGKVTGIVDMLCIVTSAAEHEALDLGSVLWREDSTPLGRVRIKGRARGGWCVLCQRAYPSILSPRYLTSSGPSSSPCTPCASARRQILQRQAYVVDSLGIRNLPLFSLYPWCVCVRVHKMLNFRLAPRSSTDSCGRGDLLRGNRQARDNREGVDIFTRKVGPGRRKREYPSVVSLPLSITHPFLQCDCPNGYRMKGTDASWEHDEEPPVEAIEFSDDEAEAEFRRMRRKQK